MSSTELAKLITNIVFAIGSVLLVLFAKIPWWVGVGIMAATLAPSSAPVVLELVKNFATAEKPPRGPSVLLLSGVALLSGFLTTACPPNSKGPTVDVDGGVAVVTGACTLIEGITQNQTVLSVCATAEEIALIVATIAQFMRTADALDAGCTVVPTTNFCATHAEIGRAIQVLLQHRGARLLVEAGR